MRQCIGKTTTTIFHSIRHTQNLFNQDAKQLVCFDYRRTIYIKRMWSMCSFCSQCLRHGEGIHGDKINTQKDISPTYLVIIINNIFLCSPSFAMYNTMYKGTLFIKRYCAGSNSLDCVVWLFWLRRCTDLTTDSHSTEHFRQINCDAYPGRWSPSIVLGW